MPDPTPAAENVPAKPTDREVTMNPTTNDESIPECDLDNPNCRCPECVNAGSDFVDTDRDA